MKMHLPIAMSVIAAVGCYNLCAASPCSADSAEMKEMQLDLPVGIEPSTAVGLLISSDNTIEKLNAKIQKTSHGSYVISFPYSTAEIRSDTVASALVLSALGEASFANVKAVLGNEYDEALASIPDCPSERVSGAGISGQTALLEQLVEIRSKLKAVALGKLTHSLSGDFLDKLRKLEKGFGLAREKELDPSLPPVELIDRLSRIQAAVRNWEARTPDASTEAPQAAK